MSIRRLRLVSLVLAGLGFGTLALASGGARSSPAVPRPVAVEPAAEQPSAAFLERQSRALPQPSGEHGVGTAPVVPRIASPQR